MAENERFIWFGAVLLAGVTGFITGCLFGGVGLLRLAACGVGILAFLMMGVGFDEPGDEQV